MANTYDLHNPKHFCFDMEPARVNYNDGYPDDTFVEIYPREAFGGGDFGQYEEKDYSPDQYDGEVDFTWAPKCMFDQDGKLEQGYENAFKFTGNPDDLEKELRALGLVSIEEDI